MGNAQHCLKYQWYLEETPRDDWMRCSQKYGYEMEKMSIWFLYFWNNFDTSTAAEKVATTTAAKMWLLPTFHIHPYSQLWAQKSKDKKHKNGALQVLAAGRWKGRWWRAWDDCDGAGGMGLVPPAAPGAFPGMSGAFPGIGTRGRWPPRWAPARQSRAPSHKSIAIPGTELWDHRGKPPSRHSSAPGKKKTPQLQISGLVSFWLKKLLWTSARK